MPPKIGRLLFAAPAKSRNSTAAYAKSLDSAADSSAAHAKSLDAPADSSAAAAHAKSLDAPADSSAAAAHAKFFDAPTDSTSWDKSDMVEGKLNQDYFVGSALELSESDMDLIEEAAYGDVRRAQVPDGCCIQ